jgi:hypothetical protein
VAKTVVVLAIQTAVYHQQSNTMRFVQMQAWILEPDMLCLGWLLKTCCFFYNLLLLLVMFLKHRILLVDTG